MDKGLQVDHLLLAAGEQGQKIPLQFMDKYVKTLNGMTLVTEAGNGMWWNDILYIVVITHQVFLRVQHPRIKHE